jgi:hypothetical protein
VKFWEERVRSWGGEELERVEDVREWVVSFSAHNKSKREIKVKKRGEKDVDKEGVRISKGN